MVIRRKEWPTAVWRTYARQWLRNLSYIKIELKKKKITSKSFVLGCDTYTLDGSEITEGDQMGLPARDRDYLQIILSIFILLKLRMLQTLPLSFFLCRYSEGLEFSYNENNGFICHWRWVFLSACPYATKLRVIPCSLGDSGLSM